MQAGRRMRQAWRTIRRSVNTRVAATANTLSTRYDNSTGALRSHDIRLMVSKAIVEADKGHGAAEDEVHELPGLQTRTLEGTTPR